MFNQNPQIARGGKMKNLNVLYREVKILSRNTSDIKTNSSTPNLAIATSLYTSVNTVVFTIYFKSHNLNIRILQICKNW